MAASMADVSLPDVNILRGLARDQLIMCLESLPGRKDLVLDPALMRPLDRLAGASLLKEHGVEKIFKLEPAKAIQGCDQRMYMVRPHMSVVNMIADQINGDKNLDIKRTYKILFVPRKLYTCERILEQEGVHGNVTIDEFPLDLVPLDKDILSLELPEFLRSVFLEKDTSWCHTAARALITLQGFFGLIPNVYGQGNCSKRVYDLMELMHEHEGGPNQLSSEIGHLFLFDRDVDYVTPLCSQVTYEGLLDDTFGISSGFIEFGSEVTGRDQPTKLLLTSQDSVFEEIRDRHFSNVFGFLSAKAKELQAGYDKRHDLKSVSAMKNFVANDLKGLKQQHKALSLHIGACEVILTKKTKGDFEDQLRTEHSLLEGVDTKESIGYIEEIIQRQLQTGTKENMLNPTTTLRLMCLLSRTKDGLSPDNYKYLKTQFLQSHGFEHMLTFHNLKQLGLLEEREAAPSSKPLGKVAAITSLQRSSAFRALSKKLNLIPKSAEDINLKLPTDMSYVFSGAFTPLLCKIVEQVLVKESFVGLEDVIRNLPGENFTKIRAKSMKGSDTKRPQAIGETKTPPSPGRSAGAGERRSSKIVLVFFLGGCTYSEITALRFLGRLRGYKFIIMTTNLVNGTKLIEQISEKGWKQSDGKS